MSIKNLHNPDVVVVSYGAVSAAGLGSGVLWNAAWLGQSFIRLVNDEVDEINTSKTKCNTLVSLPRGLSTQLKKQATHIMGIDHETDPFIAFGLEACRQAIKNSGLHSALPELRVAVCVGTAVGGVSSMEKNFRNFLYQKKEKEDAFVYDNFSASTLNRYVSQWLALKRYAMYTVATGCTAGLDSILLGHRLLKLNKCDIAIVGAAEAPLADICFTAFDRANCLSSSENPKLASCPFSWERSGFVMGEGAAILLLTRRDVAERLGVTSNYVLMGGASTSNAFHMTALTPHNNSHVQCVQAALRDSKVAPEKLDYIVSHGTSTPQNDISETNTIKVVLGKRAERVPVSSNKSMFGHALGAAGALSSILAIEGLKRQRITPTISHGTDDPSCNLDYVREAGRDHLHHSVMVNASSFSGIHTTVMYSLGS